MWWIIGILVIIAIIIFISVRAAQYAHYYERMFQEEIDENKKTKDKQK